MGKREGEGVRVRDRDECRWQDRGGGERACGRGELIGSNMGPIGREDGDSGS